MAVILDDQVTVKKVDIEDMLSDLGRTSEYCRDAIQRAGSLKIPHHKTAS